MNNNPAIEQEMRWVYQRLLCIYDIAKWLLCLFFCLACQNVWFQTDCKILQLFLFSIYSIYYLGYIMNNAKMFLHYFWFFAMRYITNTRLGLDDMSKGLKNVKQKWKKFCLIKENQRIYAEPYWSVSVLSYQLFLRRGISSNTLPILMQALWLLLDIRWFPVYFLHLHKIESFIVDSYSTIHKQVDQYAQK